MPATSPANLRAARLHRELINCSPLWFAGVACEKDIYFKVARIISNYPCHCSSGSLLDTVHVLLKFYAKINPLAVSYFYFFSGSTGSSQGFPAHLANLTCLKPLSPAPVHTGNTPIHAGVCLQHQTLYLSLAAGKQNKHAANRKKSKGANLKAGGDGGCRDTTPGWGVGSCLFVSTMEGTRIPPNFRYWKTGGRRQRPLGR